MKTNLPIYNAMEDVIESLNTLALKLTQQEANDLAQDVIAIRGQLKLIQIMVGISEASTMVVESILNLPSKRSIEAKPTS